MKTIPLGGCRAPHCSGRSWSRGLGPAGFVFVLVTFAGWTRLTGQDDRTSRGSSTSKRLEPADAGLMTAFAQASVARMQAFHQANPNFQQLKGPATKTPPPQVVDEKGETVAARDGDPPQAFGEAPYREGLEAGGAGGAAPAPALTRSFQGVIDNRIFIPPDTMGAVGPNHVVEFLNTGFTVFTRNGGSVLPQVSLQAFWSSLGVGIGQPAVSPFDPKVLYDQYAGRWVVTSDSRDNSNAWVLVGISLTSDPTGLWNLFGIRSNRDDGVFNHVNDWSDFPGMGLDPNNVIITNNMFPLAGGAAIHADVWVIAKASLMAGGGALTQGIDYKVMHDPCGTLGFTFQPCHTFGQSPATAVNYIIDEGWIDLNTRTRRHLRIKRISGTGASATLACAGGNDWLEVAPYNFNKLAGPQPSCAAPIDTGDTRMLNAVWRNGKIWATHGVGIGTGVTDFAPPSRTQVAWYEMNPAATGPFPGSVPNQQGHVSDSALYYSYPSIAVNKDECVALGFSGLNETTLGSSYYTARFATDSPGTMRTVARLHAGRGHYFKQFSGARNRWGDYSAMTVDPVDDQTFWTVQEHAEVPFGDPYSCELNSGRWGTWWGAFRCVPPPDVKFSQPPAAEGENMASNIDWADEIPNVVVADDFISDGRPITGVRWWGGTIEAPCAPNEAGQCADGVDNDCDGQTDCLDRDCATVPSCNDGGGLLFASEPSGVVGLPGRNLGVIDPITGLFTIVGPFTGAAGPITEIEWSPDGSKLYATTGGGSATLHTVDPATGTILTSVFQTIGGALNGCEFDATGALLCTLVSGGGGTSQSGLVRVNPVTGLVTPIGPTGFANVGGLAFDAAFTTLYGITSGGGSVPPTLLDINPSTGLAAPLVIVTMATEASSLEFLLDGRLVTAGADGLFYSIDLATGTATPVGPLVNAAKVSGLSVRPGATGGDPTDDCDSTPFVNEGTLSFDNTGANTDGPTARCAPLETDVWVNYVASCNGTATIDTLGSVFDTVLEVYGGCSCSPLGPVVACNDDFAGSLQARIDFPVTPGECFKVRVGGFGGDQGSGTLTITCEGQAENDLRDDCNSAPIVNEGTFSFDNTGADTDGPAATCASLETDVWVNYVATCDDIATIDTFGSAFDTVLEVYAGCSCSPLGSVVRCNDDARSFQSQVDFPVTTGECFKVRVGGFGGDRGVGMLSMTCTACPGPPIGQCQVGSTGFEAGQFCDWTARSNGLGEFLPWTVGSSGTSTGFHTSAPLSGSFDALNGFDGDAGLRYELFQDVALPAGSTISLTTNHRIQYDSLGIPSSLPRELDISIRSTSNAILTPLFHQEVVINGAPGTDLGWNTQVFDLSAFAGQTIRIHFAVFIPETDTGPAMIEFDEINLACTTAAGEPDSREGAVVERTPTRRTALGSPTQRSAVSFDEIREKYLALRERTLASARMSEVEVSRTAGDDGCPEPDGWFVGFHEPLDPAAPPRPALGLYYCDGSVVRQAGVGLATCINVPVSEHTIDLSECCLVHADVDPRSGLVPAAAEAFFEEKCFDYAIDIQAVFGHRFVDVGGVCVQQPTGTTMDDDCWGWHTTTISRGESLGLGPALMGSVGMSAVEWLYGPWDTVTPVCSQPNMAFELLTDVADGPADGDGNGIADDCERLGDFDMDGDRDLDDYALMYACLFGPGETPAPAPLLTAQDCLDAFDFNHDAHVDLLDWTRFQAALTGP